MGGGVLYDMGVYAIQGARLGTGMEPTSFGDYMNFITINCDQGDIKMQPYSEYNGQNGTTPLGIIHHPYEVPFQQAKQMDEDALSILEKRPMLAPGEEGRRDIRVVEAIYKSASSKQPVRL